MVPYIHIPPIQIYEKIKLYPFGILAGVGIFVFYFFTRKRSKQLNIPDRNIDHLFFWVLVCSFLFAHFFDVLFYSKIPWGTNRIMALLNPSSGGLSSVGGFIGAAVGGIGWCVIKKQNVLPYADACGYGITFGWLFGRTGCFMAHDHPGSPTSLHFPLAVAYPCEQPPCPSLEHFHIQTSSAFPRHDLGFYEAVLFFGLAITFLVLSRFRIRSGLFIGLLMTLYGPIRFALDFLRMPALSGGDNRYAGLTPAQFVSLMMFGSGIGILVYALKKNKDTTAIHPKPSPKNTWHLFE